MYLSTLVVAADLVSEVVESEAANGVFVASFLEELSIHALHLTLARSAEAAGTLEAARTIVDNKHDVRNLQGMRVVPSAFYSRGGIGYENDASEALEIAVSRRRRAA